jgi:hypothetical protein
VTRRSQHIAANITETIREANASMESVAQAADLSQHELELLLEGAAPIPVRVLEKVGGLLHVPPTHFLQGVA